MTKYLGIFLLTLLMVSCGGKKDNRLLKEAAAIHEETMQRYDSLYHELLDKRAEIEGRIDGLYGDKKSANESMLRSIDKSLRILDGWEESVVGVPGYEFDYHHHNHGEGDGHEHHHHSKRDNDQILRGMNDREVLALQKALKARLAEVSQEINNLLDTIKLYEAREN